MPKPIARAVRGAVNVNGTPLAGWLEFEVENNVYASADSFSCTFSAAQLPKERDANWFSQQQDMTIELFVGFPDNTGQAAPGNLPSWIYGTVDEIDYDPVEGLIEVRGRDLTHLFIDAKTTEKFQNQTASQVATALALRHGLSTQTTPTKTPIGKYYEIDSAHINDARTEWELLNYLARVEQYVVYVQGQTLVFQPQPTPDSATPYPVVWTPPSKTLGYAQAAVESIRFQRATTLSHGVVVTVKSWNDAAQHAFTVSYPPAQSQSKSSEAPQMYAYSIANMTPQKALQHAQAKYREIMQHEMKLSLTLPGNDDLNRNSVIQVSGTGTDYDQAYYPDTITRRFSLDQGYRMEVNAKNHHPDSELGA